MNQHKHSLMHTLLKAFLVILLMIAAEVGFSQPPPPPPPPPPSGAVDSIAFTNATCHGGYGQATVINLSTIPFIHYSWSNGDTTATANLLAGFYYVTITDSALATHIDSVTITEPGQVVITITVQQNPTYIGGSDGSIAAIASGGTPPYTYVWTPGAITTPQISSVSADRYCLLVADSNGCTARICDTLYDCTNCVWPGDADNSHLADNMDLLYIGLAYDSTGPTRPCLATNASLADQWVGQYCAAWVDTFAGGINNKYADCDGNGTINALDTVPLMLNFGQIHAKNNSPKELRAGKPYIYPLLDRDSVRNGDTLTVSILLGDSSLTAADVYGVAFDINYDASVIDTNQTQLTYPASWLGSPSDEISIVRDFKSLGVIKTAVTRIDHTVRNGHGTIAVLRAIVTTDNIDGKDLAYYKFSCSISNTKAVNNLGYDIDLNEGADSMTVSYIPTGISEVQNISSKLLVYPNPSQGHTTLSASSAIIKSATVYNSLGEIVAQNNFGANQTKTILELVDIPVGVYSISVQTDKGNGIKKLVITK